MRRRVSSTNLALEYVAAFGAVSGRVPVVIHHTDCDSILSSAIVQGILPSDDRFGRAAIAADHTGAENPIADLLQSLQVHRDLALSFSSLACLLDGVPLPHEAVEAMQGRLEDRKIVDEAVRSGSFGRRGQVAFGVIDRSVDTAFLPALIPDAALIVVAQPTGRADRPFNYKTRLGMGAPEGVSILDLGINEFDPYFGGRWNAGSNRRAGGSSMTPEEYAERLAAAVERWS
jgi:hypothetical protein